MNTTAIYSSIAADLDLGELVAMFVQEMPDRLDALEAHARKQDWTQLARSAHQLKGSAGSYGFQAISPFAARLEMVAKDVQNEDEILSSLNELLSICRRVRSGVPDDPATV